MAIYHQDIVDIELNGGSLHRSFLNHSIGLADAAANRFGVRVFRDGVAETLSGVTCQGFFRNANGENIALTSYGTIDGNVAYVTLPQACYNVEGMFTLAIKLVGGGVTGTMRIIDGMVDNTNTGSAVAPTGSVPTYQEVLSVYEQMQAAVTNYDAKVTEQDAKIGDLKSAITPICHYINVPFSAYTEQGYINIYGGYVANAGFRATDFIAVDDGSVISGYAASNGSYAIVGFYDSTKTRLANTPAYYPNTGDELTSFSVNCPTGTAYIRLSARYTKTGTNATVNWTIKSEIDKLETDVDDLQNDVTELKNDIDKQLHISFSDYTEQGYINAYGRLDTNTMFVATDFIPVDGYETISGFAASNGNYAIVAFYDDEKTKIGDVYRPNTGDVLTQFAVECPIGTRYIRSSARVANTTTYIDVTWILHEGITTLKNDVSDIENEIAVDVYRVGFVSTTSGNDFKASDIVACLWAIHNNPNAKKELHIKAGTYDIYTGLGGLEHIMQYSVQGGDTAYTEGTQPWLTNLKIVGHGNVVLEFNIPDSVEQDHYWIFSCLNVRGNFEMENVEIHSSNCRYAIHDESKDDYPDTIQQFTNVRIYNNVLAGIHGGQAVGCGFAQRMSVYMNNCYIEDGFASAWTCHANNGVMLTFNGCIFVIPDSANYRSVRVSQNGQTNVSVRFVSCYLSKGLRLSPENASDTSIIDTTEVTGVNTDLTAIVKTYNVVQKRVIMYNAITQTKTIVVDVT